MSRPEPEDGLDGDRREDAHRDRRADPEMNVPPPVRGPHLDQERDQRADHQNRLEAFPGQNQE